ncbi:50S ribosomal protein l36 [Trifolium pratense]|uniref:50S ribosomal protein l36 n=1 Tax=Trifolium pratense TaxID=57577 RepID=A0A2K3N301_TRIPR|nr:50S ribosomal protein l36 [Trifolium pratense]
MQESSFTVSRVLGDKVDLLEGSIVSDGQQSQDGFEGVYMKRWLEVAQLCLRQRKIFIEFICIIAYSLKLPGVLICGILSEFDRMSVDISPSSATQEIKPIYTLRTGLASIVPQRHSLSMLYGWRVGLASILSKK